VDPFGNQSEKSELNIHTQAIIIFVVGDDSPFFCSFLQYYLWFKSRGRIEGLMHLNLHVDRTGRRKDDMNGLGRVQTSTQVVSDNVALEKAMEVRKDVISDLPKDITPSSVSLTKAVDIAASLKARFELETGSVENSVEFVSQYSTFRKTFPELIREILATIEEGGKEKAISNSDSQKENKVKTNNFGFEPLSYKQMWKVLKTVVKEIGNIREAQDKRFSLDAKERLDTPSTHMEFSSLVDYLKKHSNASLKNLLSGPLKQMAEQIASDSDTSLHTQLSIKPQDAVELLSIAG
jgi:hypothetical protein